MELEIPPDAAREVSGIEPSDTWEITAIGSVYSYYAGGDHSRIPKVILYANASTAVAAIRGVFAGSAKFPGSNRIISCVMHDRDNESASLF